MFPFLLILILPLVAFAQPIGPDSLWTRDYPDLYTWSVMSTEDGGFALAGMNALPNLPDSIDGKLVRMDSAGNVIWTRRFGNPNRNDYVWDAVHTSDGGFVLAGLGWRPDTTYLSAMLAVKYDADGDSLWSNPLRLAEDCAPDIFTLIEARNRNLVLAGTCSGVPTIVWLDSDGHLLRNRSYLPFGWWGLRPLTIVETASGRLVMGGWIQTIDSLGFHRYAGAICVDSSGDTLWTRMYDYPDGVTNMVFQDFCAFAGDSLFVAGTATENGDGSIYLYKVDPQGNIVWRQNYDPPGMGGGGMTTQRIIHGESEGFVVSATVGEVSTPIRALLYEVNQEGGLLWRRTFWEMIRDHESRGVVAVPQGGYLWAMTNHNDTRVMRLGVDPETSSDPIIPHPSSFSLSVSPNPFNSSTNITYYLPRALDASFTVFNTLGQAVFSEEVKTISAGEHRYLFDASDLPSGVYFARIEAAGMMQARKMVVLK